MMLSRLTQIIEGHLAGYCGTLIRTPSLPFIEPLSHDFLREHCPDVVDLPAAFLSMNLGDEVYIAIHLTDRIIESVRSTDNVGSLFSTREGLDALLIITEEISHFHHFIECAAKGETVSRFELELVAELEKIAICSLMANDVFGRSYLAELIQLVYGESVIHSHVTDYGGVSKMSERFWRQHLQKFGPSLLKEASFRRQLQSFTRNTSQCKQHLLNNLTAA